MRLVEVKNEKKFTIELTNDEIREIMEDLQKTDRYGGGLAVDANESTREFYQWASNRNQED